MQVVDPYNVKIRKIYKDVTEEELLIILLNFGDVTRVKIPTDENGEYRGLAEILEKREKRDKKTNL